MKQQRQPASVAQRHSLLVWALICAIVGLNAIVYYASSLSAGTGAPIMPLDDVYIHFQYARQLAAFHPYVYNPGLPPTSGATSFAYPYVLAFGHGIGFSGLWLGAWAMLIGGVAQALGALWIVRIASRLGAGAGVAGLFGVIFAAHGLFAWHAFSGMETMLMSAVVLFAFERAAADDRRGALIGSALAALIRPEGVVLTAAICGYCFLGAVTEPGHRRPGSVIRTALLHAVPLLAAAVQPVVNRLATGSAVASGSSAKSLFGIIPFDLADVISRVISQFTHIFSDALITLNSVHSAWVGRALLILLLIGIVASLRLNRTRWLTLAALGFWIVAATAIATLDTAFWHFKRYQIPLFALTIPFAALGVDVLARRLPRAAVTLAVACVLLVGSVMIGLEFIRDHALNVGYVVAQPYQMARWLRENTPEEAVIAVHDVGMMRYQGDRTTLDIVGLTTPGAAESWRNGPGAVAQFITAARPDYLALYGEGHGYGLGYLQATDLFAEPLAVYTVTLAGERNVALAAATQGIYRPRWERADLAAQPHALPQTTPWLDGMTLIDRVDTADLVSERDHDYRWTASGPLGGFPTEVFQFGTIGCLGDACELLDGGRRISGEENFQVAAAASADAILVTRVHAQSACVIDVYAQGQHVSTRVIPSLPGSWYEYAVLIPAELISDGSVAIRAVPQDGCIYQPYHHWLFSGDFFAEPSGESLLVEFQDGALWLVDFEARTSDAGLVVDFTWYSEGGATGDYKLFVHVLDPESGEIIAQQDQRPARDSLPPGNWLPGLFRDTITVNLEASAPGTYPIAFGWYDPVTFERLQPTQLGAGIRSDGGRIFIDSLVVTD